MSLIKNSIWNLLGTFASAAVMIPVLGILSRELNLESFGLLTLVLAFVGYASVLDGGFSRGVVREIAQANGDLVLARRILGTGIIVVALLGIVFGLILWISTPYIVDLIKVDDSLKEDAVAGFRWAALMILPILLGMIWMAPIEARSNFIRLNLLRTTGYFMVFGCAVFAVYISPTFSAVALGLFIGRLGMAFLSLLAAQRELGTYLYPFCLLSLKRLVKFGGWLTISSILVPLVYYLDRFVLSAFAGASVVAYYAAPAEAINKMLTLPGSVARALFPMLASANQKEVVRLRKAATIIQASLGLLLVTMVLLFGDKIMGLWLGSAYASESGLIIKILVIGVLFNSLSMIPLMELQSMGYSKVTAWAHIIEVIPIMLILILMTLFYGIVGTAVAWVFGTLLDFCLQSYLCFRIRNKGIVK